MKADEEIVDVIVEQKVEELEEEIKEGSDEDYCDYLDEFTQTSFIADEKFI